MHHVWLSPEVSLQKLSRLAVLLCQYPLSKYSMLCSFRPQVCKHIIYNVLYFTNLNLVCVCMDDGFRCGFFYTSPDGKK